MARVGGLCALEIHDKSWLCEREFYRQAQIHTQPKVPKQEISMRGYHAHKMVVLKDDIFSEYGAHTWIGNAPVTTISTVQELGSEAGKIRRERKAQMQREQEKLPAMQRRTRCQSHLASRIIIKSAKPRWYSTCSTSYTVANALPVPDTNAPHSSCGTHFSKGRNRISPYTV